jgi:hypothetical protein
LIGDYSIFYRRNRQIEGKISYTGFHLKGQSTMAIVSINWQQSTPLDSNHRHIELFLGFQINFEDE